MLKRPRPSSPPSKRFLHRSNSAPVILAGSPEPRLAVPLLPRRSRGLRARPRYRPEMSALANGVWEAYAVEYGRHTDRQVYENFTAPLPPSFPRPDAPMPLSFYIWLLRSGDHVIAVDTGFAEAEARARGRETLLSVEAALAALGVGRDKVGDVILTHLHWDHAGNHDLFPNARIHVQATEMAYCTGPCMCHAALRKPYDPASVATLVKRVHAGHVRFHEGTAEIAPGVFVHLVGGHTRGLQVVTVETRRGRLVFIKILIPDASSFPNLLISSIFELEAPK